MIREDNPDWVDPNDIANRIARMWSGYLDLVPENELKPSQVFAMLSLAHTAYAGRDPMKMEDYKAVEYLNKCAKLAAIKEFGFVYNDGGRKAAGYKGGTRDCTVRAIAIASGVPYKIVYRQVSRMIKSFDYTEFGKDFHMPEKHKRVTWGVTIGPIDSFVLNALGFESIPVSMKDPNNKDRRIPHVTLKNDPDGIIPRDRTLIIKCDNHTMACINGVIHDRSDDFWDKPIWFYYIKDEIKKPINKEKK